MKSLDLCSHVATTSGRPTLAPGVVAVGLSQQNLTGLGTQGGTGSYGCGSDANPQVATSHCSARALFDRARRAALFVSALMGAAAVSPAARATTFFGVSSIPGTGASITVSSSPAFAGQSASCANCLSASAAQTTLGSFDLSITGNNGLPNNNGIQAVGNGIYSEGVASYGTLSLVGAGGTLLSATIMAFTVFANPNLPVPSTATVDFVLTGITSNVVANIPSAGHFWFTGTTSAPVTTTPPLSYLYTYFNPMTIDLGGTLSDTAYSPPVPEPQAWALMLVGALTLGAMRYRRQRFGIRATQ